MKTNEVKALHGWDDEKIYFWDEESAQEYCVSDEEELYHQLEEICREYFNKDLNRRNPTK